MGNKKYFFFDYDGTLAVPRTRSIPQSTLEALDELRAQGHFIALATGRLQVNAVDYIDSAGITNIVADGGYSVTLNGELKWMEGLPLPWAVSTTNELVRYSPREDFAEIAGDYYVPTKYDPNLRIDDLDCIYKAYIPCSIKDEDMVFATGALNEVPHVRYDSDTIFVEPMDKQRGIKRTMNLLDAPYEDVVVFGDGFNDVSMFIPEWTSIAMGNARQVLKERANFVTTNCDDDGIMNACKHYGWIRG